MGKTLVLEKRGGDFYTAEMREASDVGNYRVGVYDYSVKGKDGRDYIIEFGECTHYNWRKTHKVTGKPLKHEIREVIVSYGLHLDTQYERDEVDERTGRKWKSAWRNSKLEQEVWDMHLPYTLENILKVVNYISADEYTAVEFKEEK